MGRMKRLMARSVKSFSKINLGLRIGPVRGDGYHGLLTMYQTLALDDVVTVRARRSAETRIALTTNDARVPTDARNTVWKMTEAALRAMGLRAEVEIHIEKRLPVQGGLGAGSANAAAALLGLEGELGAALSGPERLKVAAEVGSDVPLFLVGGAVLGMGRGEQVVAMPDVTLGDGLGVPCVVAVPPVGVSTPEAFRDWDARRSAEAGPWFEDEEIGEVGGDGPECISGVELTSDTSPDRLEQLSLAYASAYALSAGGGRLTLDTSGIVGCQSPEGASRVEGRSRLDDLAGNTLLALVRTGIENDFEEVVFPHHPSLRETKRLLMGEDSGRPAMYAALSGSGSALFGLYRSVEDAREAQRRVRSSGVEAILTETLPRAEYWAKMFAEAG